MPLHRYGVPIWRISRFGVTGPILDRKLHICCLELKAVISALGHWATMLHTPTPTVCGPPSHHFIPPRSAVTTGVHLGWEVVPSARLGALM